MHINHSHHSRLLSLLLGPAADFHSEPVNQDRPEEVSPVMRHRHFVAIPIIAISLLLLYLTNQRASLLRPTLIEGLPAFTEAVDGDTVVTLSDGSSAQLFQGSAITNIDGVSSLERGSMLVRAQGPAYVRVGELSVQLLHGAAHISTIDSAVTIAALTTPVFVQGPEGELLVPTGFQWRMTNTPHGFTLDAWSEWAQSQQFDPLPQEFLLGMQDHLRAFPEAAQPAEATMIDLSAAQKFWQLPGAQKRAEEEAVRDLPQTVASLLAKGQVQDVQTLLAEPQVQQKLNDPALLSAVLSLPSPDPQILDTLLVSGNAPELALLSSLRSDIDPWGAQLPEHLTALRLRMGFVSNDGELALSGTARMRAEADLTSLLSAAPEEMRPIILADVLSQIHTTAKIADAKNFPERSRALTSFAQDIARGQQDLLNDDAKAALSALESMERPAILTPEELAAATASSAASEASVSSTPAEPLSQDNADEVIAAATQMVRETNGMLSTETSITAIAPHTARVTGVFYATPKGDKGLGFLYDTEAKELREITFDGKLQPFPMGEDAFAQWLKGGEEGQN